jgi:hypothetical protein
MPYSYLDQVVTDYKGYVNTTKGIAFTLADVQSIAVGRWLWLVAQWDVALYSKLKFMLPKSDFFTQLLHDLNSEVTTQKLFNTTNSNPFLKLSKFIKYKPILGYIPLSEIALTSSESLLLENEKQRLRSLSVNDFRDMTTFLRSSAATVAQAVGLGDVDGILVQDFPIVTAQRGYSSQDLEEIGDVFDLADEIDGIIYYLQKKTTQNPNLLAVANRNSDENSVVFEEAYVSAIAVPFVGSLEDMAERFLGSKEKWFDLAAINNLQPPYVDKTGTKEYLLGPATLSSVKISSTAGNALKIGSKVKIGSFSVKEESRTVIKLTKFEDGTMIVFLSGASDLAKLKQSEKSYIKTYKPQTVNEDAMILVPVDARSLLSSEKKPSLDVLKKLDKALLDFGVDIHRDEATGEISIGKNGDFDIIYGMPAVKQAIYSLLKTNINELPFHPNYGVPFANLIGERFYGSVQFVTAFSQVLQEVILSDGRYSEAFVQNLTVNETSIAINLIVVVNGSNVIIPLSFVSQ